MHAVYKNIRRKRDRMQQAAAQLLDGGPSMQVERVPLQEVSRVHIAPSFFFILKRHFEFRQQ